MLYFNILFSLIPQLSVMREKETARERIAARHKGARNDNQGKLHLIPQKSVNSEK